MVLSLTIFTALKVSARQPQQKANLNILGRCYCGAPKFGQFQSLFDFPWLFGKREMQAKFHFSLRIESKVVMRRHEQNKFMTHSYFSMLNLRMSQETSKI